MPADFNSLRIWMRENDCNQTQLSTLIGISQGHLSAILAGKRHLTLGQAIALSVITGLAVERLCTEPDALRFLKLYLIRQNRAA